MAQGRGFVIAGTSSGCGKTTLTLGILRALRNKGVPVKSAKSGPDYIDPQFHSWATSGESLNLDAWAMSPERLRSLASTSELLVVEGAMGLFDGAPPDGRGSSADLGRHLGLPIVLIIDASRQSQSVAAVLHGFSSYDPAVKIAGIVLNRVGSDRHAKMLHAAIEPLGIPLLGTLPGDPRLELPSRHLGLVQAEEIAELETKLELCTKHVQQHLDLEKLVELAEPTTKPTQSISIDPPAQRIAIAQDAAFRFLYPHQLEDWRNSGAQIEFFSPLADRPVPDTDFVFLPGGYPELHAGRLSAATRFSKSLATAAQNATIYGECGGYMVLGEGLIDADGKRHSMTGLLPLETSFAKRQLHLGYRQLTGYAEPFKGDWNGHEFHYSMELKAKGEPLFGAQDAEGNSLGRVGLISGRVMGSYCHLIEPGIAPRD